MKSGLAFAITTSAVVLVACKSPPSPKEVLIQKAEEAVRIKLRDPESALFTDVTAYLGGGAVCGEVNSKNGFGGYAGPQEFYYDDDGVELKELPALDKCNVALKKLTAAIKAGTEDY